MNLVVSLVLAAALVVTVILGAFTIFRCESNKRGYFIFLLCTVFLYVLGYLLEVTAHTEVDAFAAVKVMYIGSTFIAPVYLLFCADYCEINLNKLRYLAPLLAIPTVFVVLLWTTNTHDLIYASYTYYYDAPVHHLTVQPGSLYYLNHVFALLCAAAACGILIHRLVCWEHKYRSRLVLLLLGALVPAAANLLFVFGLNVGGINYTPLSLVVLTVFFYILIVRYNLFEIVPRASALALDAIREAYVLLDTEMGYLGSNPAACRVFPDMAELAVGADVRRLAAWPQELAELDKEARDDDIRFTTQGEQKCFYNANVNPVFAENGRLCGWVVLMQDVTGTVTLMERLEEVANTDDLTGITNRRRFSELAQMHVSKAARVWSPYSVIMFDLDLFKKVNDTYGHDAGDAVLKVVAERVASTLRPYDVFARYGGEEFIILAADTDEVGAVGLAERLRACIGDSAVDFEDKEIRVTVSLGVAPGAKDRVFEHAIRNADRALYEAKGRGRNCTVLCSATGGPRGSLRGVEAKQPN